MIALAGGRALVTGAGSGIGRAIALALAASGMQLVLIGRDFSRLKDTADASGGEVKIATADLAREEGIAIATEAAGDTLDVLVHSAGAYRHDSVTETSPAAWQALEAVNLHAPIRLTTTCLAALRARRGQVVIINSSAALRRGSGGSYAISKHALWAAADALRQEIGPYGIRVLSIFPGRTDTPMQAAVLRAEGRRAAPGSLMRPEDVALMVLAALQLPPSAEVTDIIMRAAQPL